MKTSSLNSLYKENLCVQMRKAPDLWCASLPSQTTKALPWKKWEEFTSVLQKIVPFQRKSPGSHNSSYCYEKNCILACWCSINRASPNWGVTGGCVSVIFLRMTSDFRADLCDCREGTGKIGDKIYKANPDCGDSEMTITRMTGGELFIQILVSLEALLPIEQHGGNKFRQQN